MNLNETEVNNYLQPFLGRYEDSLQDAWVDILESNPQTLKQITPIIKRVRTKAIKQYMNKKYREEGLYKPIGKNGDENFTLESILASPEAEDSEDRDNGNNGLYKKMVDFLIGEYLKQKNENLELKKRDMREGTRPGPVFIPAVDILENTNEIIVLADMPGVESKSVDIDLKDNQLTITGKVDAPEGEKEMSLYKEFNWGDYFRQFTLSNVIDQGKISAKMENGVLRLVLPKVEKAKPQKIKVVTG
jgi:HSP20 family molecular chaperone IbpA